jgi:hypothetical protein
MVLALEKGKTIVCHMSLDMGIATVGARVRRGNRERGVYSSTDKVGRGKPRAGHTGEDGFTAHTRVNLESGQNCLPCTGEKQNNGHGDIFNGAMRDKDRANKT